MKRLFYIFALITIFGTETLCAQNAVIQRAVQIKTKEKNAVRVYEVERQTETLGNYSSTTIEYMIENRTNRILEGEFEFPLLDGENVAGFALDINGKMRKAVSVEKEKGRQVFESVVRRGVDPGLVEKTEGNNFKTRVYPIPANGVRHLIITVEKEISLDKNTAGEVFTQTIGKDTFFYFYEPVNVKKELVKKLPSSITVLFDVSASAKNRDISKEINFINEYIDAIQKSKKKGNGPEVNIITFSNDINEVKTFGLKAAPLSEIESFIKGQSFDGATSFDFNLSKVSSDEILLFSDGLENWSNAAERNWKTNVPVHTICSSLSANYSLLKNISNEYNGVYVNLNEMDLSFAVQKLQENSLRVLTVEYNGLEIGDLFPLKGSLVETGISVSGILKKKEGKIKITLGKNGKTEKVIEKTISAVNSKDSEFVSRLWAMKKLESLETDKEYNKNEILELAKKYTIVTENMSLIVLDSVQDYMRYGIELPEDLKEEQGRITGNKIQVSPSNNLTYVYSLFEQFKQWWNAKPGEYPEKKPLPVLRERNVAASVYEDSFAPEQLNRSMVVASSRASAAVKNEMVEDEISVSGGRIAPGPTISLQAWNSKADYISVLKKTPAEKMYEKYLELKKENEMSPAFYMEVSDYFAEEGLTAFADRILSNLAELNLENSDVLRALGNKLVERKEYSKAAFIFEKLTRIRSEIPQFFRDYALACNLMGEKQKAVDALWHIVSGNWDSRFSEIQMTALNDMNAIIADAKTERLNLAKIDAKLMQNFDTDIRIVLTWNTDDCDIDLWVTDPNGEKCFYGHKYTAAGARMSRDFVQGYGPEEFMIRKAPKGKYKIEVDYYGNHQQKLLQPVIVQAEVYTNFGRENQKREVLTLQLDDIKQTFFVGEIEFLKD